MASTRLISSQEHKTSRGWAQRYQSQTRPRHSQNLGAVCFDSQVRTCESAAQSSGEPFPSRDRLAEEKTEPTSVCLLAMVDEYIEMESSQSLQFCRLRKCTHCSIGTCQGGSDQFTARCKNQDLSSSYPTTKSEIMKGLDFSVRRPLAESKLAADVARATKEADYEKWKVYEHQEAIPAKSLLRVFVLKYLKRLGYNAGICKSESGIINGFPTDEHEYVDVMVEDNVGKTDRVMVDLSFRSQFKIARPSSDYKDFLQKLPKVFVGNTFTLQRIVRLMCQATKTSLESQGMYVPPWRRASFMLAKWLSRYARTTEPNFSTPLMNKKANCTAAGKEGYDHKRVLKDWNNLHANMCPATKILAVSQTHFTGEEPMTNVTIREWQPPAVKPRPYARKVEKMIGALAMEMVDAHLNLLPQRSSSVAL